MRNRLWMMGIILLATLVSLAACQTEDASDQAEASSAEEVAEQFLTHIAEGAYDKAYAQVDDEMEQVIDESDLKDVWTSLEQSVGDHVSLAYDKKEKDGDYDIVYIDSIFSKEDVTFMVTVDEDNKIAGFFVL